MVSSRLLWSSCSLSGLVIWWPGTGRVSRSLVIDFRAKWKRLNWDLHSVVGFWMFALVFIWAFTGVYLVFPLPFQLVVNHFSQLELYGLSSSLQRTPQAQQGASVINVADTNANPPPRARRRRPPSNEAPATSLSAGSTICISAISAIGGLRRFGWSGSGATLSFCHRRVDVVESGAEPGSARVSQQTSQNQPAYPRGMMDNCRMSALRCPQTSPEAFCLCRTLEKMAAEGHIRSRTPMTPEQIQPSSIDLRLGHEAYRVRASFLANGDATITSKLEQYRLHTIDLTRPAVLEKGCVYIVPLQEELALPAQISGKANPKSSTGRLDIFTRLITDEGRQFEIVPGGLSGQAVCRSGAANLQRRRAAG